MSTSVTPVAETSTWSIDPAHASAHFKVRHMMIANVRGEFRVMRGSLTRHNGDATQSSIAVEIEAASVETREPQRDAHLRSADFLETEKYPLITFRSTRIEPGSGGGLRVEGELTIHGVTRNVILDVESVSPEIRDPWGNVRIAAAARTVIRRKDFGLVWNAALETGGVLVGDDVTIDLEVEFVKAQ